MFLFDNGRKGNALCAVFGRVSTHSAAVIVSTVHLQLSQTANLNILVIYCQLFISTVTHATLSDCITACRETMFCFSPVCVASFLSREDCVESNLPVCETLRK